jgi:transcription termination factor Rho
MTTEELLQHARKSNIDQPELLDRQELIYQVLKAKLLTSGILYGEGTLEILNDGFGFLRSTSHHYLSCTDDIYISPSQIRRFGLTTGMTISGQIRPPKENERYFALLRVEAINHRNPNEAKSRKPFDSLTPVHPRDRMVLETNSESIETRVVDLIAPIGFGQRGLIVSPPRAGKTLLLQKMSKAVLANYPNAYVIVLLIDERPEEVTDMQREVRGPKCEVVSSTFDEPASRHIQVSQMVLEKAKRLVEDGVDVVIFLDSITRLARAWNGECAQSGKLLTGGLDANAMQKPKSFFGAARKVEEGGSLTIIATALVGTGSKMDDVIFEEFKGTGNLEVVLDRSLVDRRIWPAIDISLSGTRREEALLDPSEYERVCTLRKALAEMSPVDAMSELVSKLKKTKTNAEFLLGIRPT